LFADHVCIMVCLYRVIIVSWCTVLWCCGVNCVPCYLAQPYFDLAQYILYLAQVYFDLAQP
jgi:hypothetical protein